MLLFSNNRKKLKSKQRKRRSRKLSPRFSGAYEEMVSKKKIFTKNLEQKKADNLIKKRKQMLTTKMNHYLHHFL